MPRPNPVLLHQYQDILEHPPPLHRIIPFDCTDSFAVMSMKQGGLLDYYFDLVGFVRSVCSTQQR